VARSSYVDPRVLERFDDGRTVLPVLQKLEGCEAGLPRDDRQPRACWNGRSWS
jgi:hypothetical protein